jgi:hypothetical protein
VPVDAHRVNHRLPSTVTPVQRSMVWMIVV